MVLLQSLDWFKGKSTGHHAFYHLIWGGPIKMSLKPIQWYKVWLKSGSPFTDWPMTHLQFHWVRDRQLVASHTKTNI
jgi:hypothetical protein